MVETTKNPKQKNERKKQRGGKGGKEKGEMKETIRFGIYNKALIGHWTKSDVAMPK